MSQDRQHRKRLVRVVVYAIILLTVLGMVLAVIGSALSVPARADQQPLATEDRAPVVVLGTTGTSWGDLTVLAHSTSPQADAARQLLTAFGSQQNVNLVQRTTGERTCPADAWLTLGAGARTRAVPSGESCTWPLDWSQAEHASQDAGYGARAGALADALESAGASTLAVGQGAELALTSSNGTAPRTATDLAQAVSTGLADLTVVDLGEASPQAVLEALSLLPDQARAVVASLADPASPGPLMAVLPAGTTGVGGSGSQGTQLVSPTTHQGGLVQIADLSATLSLDLAGEVPPTMTGGALVLPRTGAGGLAGPGGAAASGSGSDEDGLPAAVSTLVDDALRANASQSSTAGVSLLVICGALGLLVGSAWLLRGPRGRSLLRGTALVAIFVSALPLGAWLASLVPWWRLGAHGDRASTWCVLSACAVIIGIALTLTGVCHLALRAVSPRPLLLGALVTGGGVAGVILGDGASGARLALNGSMGMNTVVAGRFYGMSNTAFALAAGALLVTLAAAVGPWACARPGTRRSTALAGVLVPGALAVLLDALPATGADVGGAITLVAALVVLAVSLVGGRLGWRRWLVLSVASFSTAGVLGVIDHANGSRTHMGRFITQLQDGSAATTLRRKATAGIAPFLSSPLALAALLVGLLVTCVLAWWLRREVTAWHSGRSAYAGLIAPRQAVRTNAQERVDEQAGPETLMLLPQWFVPAAKALGVLVVVEVLVNDSGASMAVLTAAAAAPLLLALVTARLGESR